MEKIVYSVVVPVYNEQEMLSIAHKRITEVMKQTNESYEIIFVNDGSRDRTREILLELSQNDSHVVGINFSKNFGQQAATTCGFDKAQGEAVITIDCDMQDPPETILEMVEKWKGGAKIVLAKRRSRKKDTFLKRFTAWGFYRVMTFLTGGQLKENAGDFRLMDRSAVEALKLFREKNRMFKLLASCVGFKTEVVEFDRVEREAGDTKYTFKSLLKLATRGMIAGSNKPLYFANKVGIFFIFISLLAILTLAVLHIFTSVFILYIHYIIPVISLFGGFILLAIGINGSYIGAVYEEVRNRPIYIIDDEYRTKI